MHAIYQPTPIQVNILLDRIESHLHGPMDQTLILGSLAMILANHPIQSFLGPMANPVMMVNVLFITEMLRIRCTRTFYPICNDPPIIATTTQPTASPSVILTPTMANVPTA
eukprot:228676_1